MSKDYSTTLLVDQSPEEVFNAVNNVRAWWSGDVEGNTSMPGDEFTYRSGDFHFCRQKIVESIPFSKVVWLVTDSKINFVENKSEWTGTQISFEISKQENKTELVFTHHGLMPGIECYGSCSNGWSKLIQQSLLSLITAGKGVKVF